jgi:hypothetical protein
LKREISAMRVLDFRRGILNLETRHEVEHVSGETVVLILPG